MFPILYDFYEISFVRSPGKDIDLFSYNFFISLPQDSKSFPQVSKSLPEDTKSFPQDSKSFPRVTKSCFDANVQAISLYIITNLF